MELSRERLAKEIIPLPPSEQKMESVVDMASYRDTEDTRSPVPAVFQENLDKPKERPLKFSGSVTQKKVKDHSAKPGRKTISEVLHDIYDKNIQ